MFHELTWDHAYDTGVEEVDLQHRYFLHLINRLAIDLKSASVLPEMKKRLVMELIKYAEFHFASEENLLTRLGYPDVEHHRLLHGDLLDNLSAMLDSPDKLIDYIQDWFLHHTVAEDGKFGRYFREK